MLPVDDPALLLLQRVRDEAHRFAVTFNRLRRAKRDLRLDLDGFEGLALAAVANCSSASAA